MLYPECTRQPRSSTDNVLPHTTPPFSALESTGTCAATPVSASHIASDTRLSAQMSAAVSVVESTLESDTRGNFAKKARA
eukprot:5338961-Pleurochrysis_carterae.AAC.2